MIAPRLLLLTFCLPVALPAQSSEAASWAGNLHATASSTASWIENVSRTSNPATRKDAAVYEVSVALAQPRQLAAAWLLQTSLEAAYLYEPAFSLNDRTTLGPRASLQYKFGLGPYAPVLQLSAVLTYQDARFSGNSGWTTGTSLRLAKRLTPTLRAAVFGEWREHQARSWVFDTQQHTLGLEAFWSFASRWQLTAHLSRLEGDLVVNAAPHIWAQAIGGGLGATVQNYYRTIPQDTTQLYGPRWVSYNVAAHADLWWLALAHRFNPATSLELRSGDARVVNRIDITYPSRHWSLSLTHQF